MDCGTRCGPLDTHRVAIPALIANIGVDTAITFFEHSQAWDFRTYPGNCRFVAVQQTFGSGHDLPNSEVVATTSAFSGSRHRFGNERRDDVSVNAEADFAASCGSGTPDGNSPRLDRMWPAGLFCPISASPVLLQANVSSAAQAPAAMCAASHRWRLATAPRSQQAATRHRCVSWLAVVLPFEQTYGQFAQVASPKGVTPKRV